MVVRRSKQFDDKRASGDPQFNHQYLSKREGLSPRLCYSRDQITGFLLVPAQLKLT